MAATTPQTKPKSNYMRRKEKGIEDAMFVRNLSYEFAYTKSYEEVVKEIHQQLAEEAAEQTVNTIKTMFKKTGWAADKIVDVTGLPIDLVQKTLNELGQK